MDVTTQLVKVFGVEKQLRGLRSRLTGAEKFLSDQDKELGALEAKKATLEQSIKLQQASAANVEGEMKRVDARMTQLRTQMDNSQSNKEYKAFLTELNTLKAERDRHEGGALEQLAKVDELKKSLAEIVGKLDERQKLRKVAAGDRDQRHNEIASRVKELSDERQRLVNELPAEILRDFERLLHQRGDDAMGAIEVVDAKRHEYHCGVCMMSLPIDRVVGLLKGSDRPTRCSSCQCILYIDEETTKLLQPAGSKR
jgi:predicted  nucleic acid-binding Zn-ribbon protein